MPIKSIYSLLLVLITYIESAAQQGTLLSPAQYLTQITRAVNSLDSTGYTAYMRIKEFGSDSFDIRRFEISYRTNSSNLIYGYDWEVSELRDKGYVLTFMVVSNSLYIIHNGERRVNYRSLLRPLEPGSYFETMRSYLVLFEPLAPLLAEDAIEAEYTMEDEKLVLTYSVNEDTYRNVIVDTSSYLPVGYRSVIKNHELDVEQIIEIDYMVDSGIALPDTALNPSHYTSMGYELDLMESNPPQDKPYLRHGDTLDLASTALLMHSKLVSDNLDTVRISGIGSRYILLNFWYASCLPCLESMPAVNDLALHYNDKDLMVLGVNCFDSNIISELTIKLKSRGIQFTTVYAQQDFARKLNVSSFPTYFIVSPDRQVRYMSGGVEQVRDELSMLLGRK